MNVNDPVIASRRRRIIAFLVDHTLLSALAAFAGFAQLGPQWDAASAVDFANWRRPIFAVVMAVYFCKDIVRGQSLGRYLFGIAVRSRASAATIPSAGKLILRNLFLVIWPVEFIALAVNPNRQRIGDRAAGTCVVVLPVPLRPRLVAGTALVASSIGIVFLGMSAIARSSAAYATATAYLRADAATEATVGSVQGFGRFPFGSIQVTNGYGRAELSITVHGTERSAKVRVLLEKEPDQPWSVEAAHIER